MSITISSKNQIVIPKEVRLKMNLTGGDTLVVNKISSTEVIFKKAPSAYDLIGIVGQVSSDPVRRTRDIRKNWR